MSLKTKVLLIITAVFICTIGLVYAVSRLTFIRGLEEIEAQNTGVQVEQAVGGLSYLINDLEVDTADWSAWDDTYEFIQDHNQEYIESNLVDETFVTLNLHAMLFIDHSGNIVYGKAYDIENNTEIPVPTDLLSHFSEDSPLLSTLEQNQVIAGILELKEGLRIVSAQPILTSENEGPALGTLVFIRLLNEDTIQELSGIIHFPITVLPIHMIDSQDIKNAIASLHGSTGVAVVPRDDDTVCIKC
jgi:sensor domain CHASE-containing protein